MTTAVGTGRAAGGPNRGGARPPIPAATASHLTSVALERDAPLKPAALQLGFQIRHRIIDPTVLSPVIHPKVLMSVNVHRARTALRLV